MLESHTTSGTNSDFDLSILQMNCKTLAVWVYEVFVLFYE